MPGPYTGGTNGSVTAVSEGAGGIKIVTIEYPGPPPYSETYDPAPACVANRSDAAKPPVDKVDVMVDSAGAVTGAKNHK